MGHKGLALAVRFSYPPNSLSLCGPIQKQKDLRLYAGSQLPDAGTAEILSQFATLYPYLLLIAGENRITDPFDRRVIEAYWVGNSLLKHIPYKTYIRHLSDTIGLHRKETKRNIATISDKIADGALPHHSFHVLNIYKRTGHLDINHTVATMDACIINWGKVIHIDATGVTAETRPLKLEQNKLVFGAPIRRKLMPEGASDEVVKTLRIGDWVSYHWGYICTKLTPRQLSALRIYTLHSLSYANQKP